MHLRSWTIQVTISRIVSVSTHHASLLVHLPELGPDEWTETCRKVGKADKLGAALSGESTEAGGRNIHLVWRQRKIWMARGRLSSFLPEPSPFALSLARTILPSESSAFVKSEMRNCLSSFYFVRLTPKSRYFRPNNFILPHSTMNCLQNGNDGSKTVNNSGASLPLRSASSPPLRGLNRCSLWLPHFLPPSHFQVPTLEWRRGSRR